MICPTCRGPTRQIGFGGTYRELCPICDQIALDQWDEWGRDEVEGDCEEDDEDE